MHARIVFLLAALALTSAACAAVQPVNSGGPRRNQPPYPVVLADNLQRTEAANATWAQISTQQGITGKPVVALQPVTATIRSLPNNLSGSLYLSKVGASTAMNEEETRESLRRFLNEWQRLLGAVPSQFSLVDDGPNADGTKTAVYEQKPFSYPLRGDYGRVEIRFAPDRRIVSLSSTAVPDSEHIQTALNAAVPSIKAEGIPAKLVGHSFTYTDSSGPHSFTISPGNQINVQQLVVYPRLTSNQPAALEFHVAWEITLTNAPVKIIYFDPLQDEVVAVSQS